MRRYVLTLVLLSLGMAAAMAQVDTVKAVHAMAVQMCGCLDTLASTTDDTAYMAGYRTCLDAALAAHPEVLRATDAQQDGDGLHPGYQLGLLLGIAMDMTCPGKATKRLEHLHPRRDATPRLDI